MLISYSSIVKRKFEIVESDNTARDYYYLKSGGDPTI